MLTLKIVPLTPRIHQGIQKNFKKMATIKAVVRKARTDGFFPVYIRIVHRSRMGYIKTDKIVAPKGIGKSGEIIDPVVNEYCAKAILRYSDMLNRVDSHNWSVRDVINYLTAENDDVCFSDFLG